MMNKIRQRLEAMAEPDFQAFSMKIIKGDAPVLGVRAANWRRLVKEIVADDWRAFLQAGVGDSYEELVIYGSVIVTAPMDWTERQQLLTAFVPLINSWAICDAVCCCMRLTPEEEESAWDFLVSCLDNEQEFVVRFGVVGMLELFLQESFLSCLLTAWESIRHDAYYVRMAVAWAVSMAYVKFPQPMTAYLASSKLDDWTYNKALQKIIESKQVNDATRNEMRQRKRRQRFQLQKK